MPARPRRNAAARALAALATAPIAVAILSACDASATSGREAGDDRPDAANTRDDSEGVSTMVEMTAAAAADRGLPPAHIEVDLAGTGMEVFPNPEDNAYMQLSGPPGGPLGATFERVNAQPTEDGMRALAELRFEGDDPTLGPFEIVPFAGGERPAITCAVGEGPGAETHLLVLIPRPDDGGAVLFDFYTDGSDTPAAPSDILADERYAAMFRSVTVQFE